jgi:hypothetical protein
VRVGSPTEKSKGVEEKEKEEVLNLLDDLGATFEELICFVAEMLVDATFGAQCGSVVPGV